VLFILLLYYWCGSLLVENQAAASHRSDATHVGEIFSICLIIKVSILYSQTDVTKKISYYAFVGFLVVSL
jgi:hypothetical protein